MLVSAALLWVDEGILQALKMHERRRLENAICCKTSSLEDPAKEHDNFEDTLVLRCR